MTKYAWRQPDGVIAPVLQTEGYTLMVQAKDGDYWLPVIPGGVRAHWFYAEMLALAQTGVPDQAESPFQVGALLSSNDPELPVGSVVVDCHGELWYRPTLEADEDPRRCWVSRDDAQSWTKVAGNYGPVRVIALPQA